MKIVVKILALLIVLVLASVFLAWRWYLRPDTMEPPRLAGQMESGSLEHNGLVRTWRAYIPAMREGPVSLLMVLHGSRGDGQRMLEGTRYGFNILDDVGFLQALVREMRTLHGIDPSRVYVAGMSNGGQMAYRMGLEVPASVTGIAAIAANLPVDENLDCEPSGEPVATLIINGTEDPVNPYGGGVVEIFGNTSRGQVLSAEKTARYWAAVAGYTGEGARRVWPETAAADGTSVESIQWSAAGRPAVTLITVVGGGHTIPHTGYRLPRILGRTSHEFDAATVIWEFFSGGN